MWAPPPAVVIVNVPSASADPQRQDRVIGVLVRPAPLIVSDALCYQTVSRGDRGSVRVAVIAGKRDRLDVRYTRARMVVSAVSVIANVSLPEPIRQSQGIGISSKSSALTVNAPV